VGGIEAGVRSRERLLVVLGVLAGAGLALLAAGRIWVTQDVDDVPGVRTVTAAGNQVAPAVPALALVAAAGAVALLVAGRVGRRLAGLAIAVAGGGVVATVVSVLADARSAAAGAVPAATGRSGPLPDPAVTSPWVWVALVAGVVTAGSGAAALVRAAAWPRAGRRFEPTTRAEGRTAAGGGSAGAGDSVTAWDALSRGDDPTT
jgi:uncharacterized membrane protein (TIGR02234 family)